MKKKTALWVYYSVMVLLVLLDQGVKAWTVHHLPLGGTQPLFPPLVSLLHIRNTGAAWGVLADQQVLFLIVTVVVVLALLYTLHHKARYSHFYSFSLALVIAGALGNFIDRMRLHYVVDMFKLDFIDFPIFNLADSAITIGVGLLTLYLFFFDTEVSA